MTEQGWFVATWNDPELLSGESVASAIADVLAATSAPGIVVSGFQGKGSDLNRLPQAEDATRSFRRPEILSILNRVLQVEWCDFFVPEEGTGDTDFETGSYQETLPKTVCLLRAVDGHLLMAYARDEQVIEAFSKNRDGVTIERCSLDEMDFPV